MSTLQTSLNTPILATGAGSHSIVLGDGAASATNTIAFGTANGTTASAAGGIAIGSGGFASTAGGIGSIAIGSTSTSGGNGSIAVGSDSSATQDSGIAIGANNVESTGSGSIAIGSASTCSSDASVAIGQSSICSEVNSVSIGRSAHCSGDNSVCIGSFCTNPAGASVAIGSAVSTADRGDIVIGVSSGASQNSICIGNTTSATGIQSIALGYLTSTSFDNTVAIGTGATSQSSKSICLGAGASAVVATNCVAIGYNATATGSSGQHNVWTIGNNVTNNIPGSMLLGGNAGGQNLTLIWNDNTADLGSSSHHFGSLYINNIIQNNPSAVTAYTTALGTQSLTAATPALLNGATMTILSDPNSEFSVPSSTSLQYNGASTKWFDVSFMVSCTTPAAITPNIKFWLVHNGTVGTPTDVSCNFNSTDSISDHSLRKIIQLASGDSIWIAVETDITNASYVFNACSITATQI